MFKRPFKIFLQKFDNNVAIRNDAGDSQGIELVLREIRFVIVAQAGQLIAYRKPIA